ncbi:MAG: outer membrane lipoprotein-sorting protein [Gammaproteobacteria bacterium]|nr:outer membrane lipoprotein-sorting protein [Gammaproteobacteria bacterium]
MKINGIKAIVTLLLISLAWGAQAETAEEKGLEIAIAMDERDTGFHDLTADMVMTLRNRKGDESVRDIRIRTLEVEGDGDKSISIFDRPRDIKGTAMLTFSHGLEPDDQWLYLPGLKRVKRISSKNKSGPFMGSEFAYEDLSSQELEKYTYKWLRDEPCGDWQCYVIERIPAYKYSGYKRIISWIDKAEYRAIKVEYFDRKNSKLKTLIMSDYNEYIDRYWRAGDMFMENHQTGKSTRLEWKNYQFQTGLTEKDFNKNALKRIR